MGWRAPITVSNRSGFITRGHGRLEAATLLGCEQVPVDFQDCANELAELADMLADNHLAELAEIDEDRLVGVLKQLQAAGHDVGLAGFTEDEVARLTAVEEEIDRKSTRLNSSHITISYAVFCLKKKRTE